ncbi:MAG: Firmicu-CTERM sorting domain-containing protein [Oenococcus sp.]|uniref:Firmicu-CTERM sorting domain-containing protein n=1 Tax=Oenococcus sp. TaxID=1979414 RepID=UPI0039E7F8AE
MRKIILAFACVLSFAIFIASPVQADTTQSTAGIVIDGKFDDWKNKPIEDWYYGTLPWISDAVHVSLLSDNEYIYLYVDMDGMNRGRGQKLPTDNNYYFTIGNTQFQCNLTTNPRNWQDAANFGSLQPGQSAHFNIFAQDYSNPAQSWQKTTAGGEGIVAERADGTQVAEMRIPISDLGINTISGQRITFRNPHLGPQTITIEGASTGPYVLAAGGFLIALAAVFGFSLDKFFKNRVKIL